MIDDSIIGITKELKVVKAFSRKGFDAAKDHC